MAGTVLASSYATWGAKLARDYLEDRVPLTTGLRKLAQQEQLNSHQVRRVAENVNNKVWNDLLPHRADFGGDPRFEPADADAVIQGLNDPGKLAEDFSDFYAPPQRRPTTFDQVVPTFGGYLPKIAEDLEKRAEAEEAREKLPVDHATAAVLLRKLAEMKNDLELERFDLARLSKEALDSFREIVRQMVIEGSDVMELFKAAVYTRPDQRAEWARLFGEITSDLDKRGYFGQKTAAPVPPELISAKINESLPSNLKVQWINGRHPLTVSVNLLGDLHQKRQKNGAELKALSDRIEKVRTYRQNLLQSWRESQLGEPMYEKAVSEAKPVKLKGI